MMETVKIGPHVFLVAGVARCDYCGHESKLRDIRGRCIACGAPMHWRAVVPPQAVSLRNIQYEGTVTCWTAGEWGPEMIEVTALGDAVRQWVQR